MKKLMVILFSALTVAAFAAQEDENSQLEKLENLEDVAVVQVEEVGLGDSFMAAFGMETNNENLSAGQIEQGAATAAASTASAATAVATSNSTTIVTPYGKY